MYDLLPTKATLKPTKFTAHVSDEAVDDFKQLLRLSKIGPATYENQKDDGYFGVSRDWLSNAKQHWLNNYDWRKTEARINSFPNFTVPVDYQGNTFDVHFVALFSQKPDAIPLTLLHGWPGSFLEFLDVVDLLRRKYSPESLPFHVIVPSLPGYGYSSGPPLNRDFTVEDMSTIIDNLMVGLGFGNGYIAQGGDVGSFICRVLGATSTSCKAVHLNMSPVGKPDDVPMEALSDDEKTALGRAQQARLSGFAYAQEHGTRPATIGLVLSSNPIALLAWIGEKFLQWTDTDPSMDEILDSITLYWFTDSFPRSIFPYRQIYGAGKPSVFHNNPKYYLTKPTGYSWFPKEIAPTPRAWVAKSCNMVWFKAHDQGGHFAAMEKPQLFLDDIEDFAAKVWPQCMERSSRI